MCNPGDSELHTTLRAQGLHCRALLELDPDQRLSSAQPSALFTSKPYVHKSPVVSKGQYTLVDIKLLDEKYLLENHDAIAVDKVSCGGLGQFVETLKSIVGSKPGFDSEEYADFLTWLKHTLGNRVGSEEEAERSIQSRKDLQQGKEITLFKKRLPKTLFQIPNGC